MELAKEAVPLARSAAKSEVDVMSMSSRQFRSAAAAGLVATAVVLALLAAPAGATTYTLQDLGSSAGFDTAPAPLDAKSATYARPGMFSWTSGGVDQMYQQWFWYRVGASGPERSLDSLTELGVQLADTNFLWDPSPDTLTLHYGNGATLGASSMVVSVSYMLRGGLDGEGLASDITEVITIVNKGATPLDMHFFQYTDLDLAGEGGGDLAMLSGPYNTIRQSGGNGHAAGEMVITPGPSHYEIALWGDTLAKLNDADADSLADIAGVVGPGDVTWAFQWDFTIPAGTSVRISKDKQLVLMPEPITVVGVMGGLAGLAGYLRRRARGAKA